MADLIWQPGALEDLDGIADRIAQHSTHYAKLQVARVFASVQVLEQYPAIGHPVPEWGGPGLRELHVSEIRVIYHAAPEQVDILAVVHMRRKLSRRTLQRRKRTL